LNQEKKTLTKKASEINVAIRKQKEEVKQKWKELDNVQFQVTTLNMFATKTTEHKERVTSIVQESLLG
jgi:uncharacterized protein with PhoU and TrkA domain